MTVTRVMLLWFWCVGEAGLSSSPPFQIPLHSVDVSDFSITYQGKKVTKIRVGKQMVAPLTKALDCLRCAHARHALKTFHGAYNRRKIHGQEKWSLHSWGIAIDINAGLTQPKIVVECFEQSGFTWGGRWTRRPDPMHFELFRRR